MKSLVIGAEENSGFSKIQLCLISSHDSMDVDDRLLQKVCQTDTPFLKEIGPKPDYKGLSWTG